MTTKKSSATELSYFRLSLLSYLRESHPDKANNQKFIAARGDLAAEAYSQAIKSGSDHIQASEISNRTLFEGLCFSPYRTLVTILWNEFSQEVQPNKAETLALELLPRLQMLIDKYRPTDDFADTEQYDLLYTELTGSIQILLEDGLQ